MHPVLTILHLGPEPRALGSYGACLALAIMLTALLSLRACTRAGLDAGATIASLSVSIGGGFLGAYGAFVLVSCAQGAGLWHGLTHPGLVFYGGALGALASFAAAARKLGLPALCALDLAAPALPFGHAIGRIGCFLGGCCYGGQAHLPWSVTYTHPLAPAAAFPVPRHPWPLYEALALVVLACVIERREHSRGPREGVRFAFYVAAYGCIRFMLEPLRGDVVRGVFFGGALSTSQLWAAGTGCAAVGFIAVRSTAVRGRRLAGLVLLPLLLLCLVPPALADRSERLSLRVPARIRVAAGAFSMGSGEADVAAAVRVCATQLAQGLCTQEAFANERPAHEVRLGAFFIDRDEVSQRLYRACVAAGACASIDAPGADAAASADDLPVSGVTWPEAVRYCRFAGGRLPTEAEWERAARGGSARTFPWGSVWNSRLANHGGGGGEPDATDGYAGVAPVGAFTDGHSLYGALQMGGNVWEWVEDRYVGAYSGTPSAHAEQSLTEERVLRGGSFLSPVYTLRATFRGHAPPAERKIDVGFRCAYDAR